MGPVGWGVLTATALGAAVAGWLATHRRRVAAALRGRHVGPPGEWATRWFERLAAAGGGAAGPRAVPVILLAGFVVVLALALVFTVLLDNVLDGDGLAHLDPPIAAWVAAHRDRGLADVLRFATHAGDPTTVMAVALVIGGFVSLRARRWLPMVLALGGAAGMGLVVLAVKEVVARQRPPLHFAAAAASGPAFPSGHSAGVATVALLGAWVLTRWSARRRATRTAIWAVAAVTIGVVGLSRVYLGVHYVSDVLAGWVLAGAWVGVLLVAALVHEAQRGDRGAPVGPASAPARRVSRAADRGPGSRLPSTRRPARRDREHR